jgi:glycosyltransferase involved in cell wall biosynthesis
MNITFVLFYYLPEKPTQNYLYQPIIDGLLKLGHRVNIITPNPTRGISPDEQKRYKKIPYENHDNLHIYRVNSFTYNPHKFSKFKLLLRYLSVSLNLARRLKSIKSDVVFTQTNPPILLSYLVSKWTKKKGIKLIYNVQDLYPDNIFDKKSIMFKLTNPYQVKTLKNATTIIPISEALKKTILTKIDDESKIKVIYNFSISEYVSDAKKEEVRERLQIDPSKFIVIYAGNIGYVQDLDVLLRAAELTKDNAQIVYHIIGEGSQANRIKQKVIDLKLTQVYFHPMQPIEDAIYLYHLASVNIISILPKVIYTALPLKVSSCLEARKPIIFIGLEEDIKEPWMNEHIIAINHRDYHKLALNLQDLSMKKINTVYFESKVFDKSTNINDYISIIID